MLGGLTASTPASSCWNRLRVSSILVCIRVEMMGGLTASTPASSCWNRLRVSSSLY